MALGVIAAVVLVAASIDERLGAALMVLVLATVAMLVVAVLPMTLLVLTLDAVAREAKAGHCAGCGYDLRGLPSGSVCPECGRGACAREAGR